MQITYRIYSDHLAAFAPEGADVHTWSRDVYADTLRKTLETRWQDAEVEVDVISRTSGYGSGPEATDDEGVPLDDIAIEVREISNRVLERLSQAEPAIDSPGLPGHEDAPDDPPNPWADATLETERLLARAKVQIEAAIQALEDGAQHRALDLLMATRSWPGFDDPRKT